ncbi:MAG: site-specific DNA-methyltransferase, partial [Candidatus Magasanikbacteria bacterium CG10_big_fil_rev_8_21_14_0_10_38_6]
MSTQDKLSEKVLLKKIEELEKELKKIKKQKKYGLVWEDKPEQIVEDCKRNVPILRLKEKKKGINPVVMTDESKDENILIEGDNYHALSVLNYTHKGKVDVIYIDPPYNTGKAKEWKYNDKFVDENDSYRHSKWISLMEKRLVLASSLLKKNGAIFISIDNNEQSTLKLLCDGIFGEKNFVGVLIWKKKEGGGQADDHFVTEHEYILVYRNTPDFKWLDEEILLEDTQFNKEDDGGKFNAVKLAKWGNTARKEDRPKMYFSIKSPDETNVFPIAPDGGDGRWRVGKKRMDFLIENNYIFWQKKDEQWVPYEKIYFEEGDVKKIKERSILYELATTADGTNELTDIFGKKDVFENPKPTELIKFLLRYSTAKNATVLDFFAGTGTLGHAVLSLNKEDGGERKFIVCTNNENNICEDVTYERLKRVM